MNDKKNIFGWLMYDWANSAFAITVVVAVLPVYFADVIVPAEGVTLFGQNLDATELWGFMLGFSAFILFLTAPILGAIADFSASKKKFLFAFCYSGCLFTILLFFTGTGDLWMTIFFFVVAQMGFIGGNVFYDAFLPQIVPENELDWISGKGFAYGYLGGGLQFAISLAVISLHEQLGISQSSAARLVLAFSGVWWAGFSIFTFVNLKEEQNAEKLPEEYKNTPTLLAYARIGISRTYKTTKKVAVFKHLSVFLIAYMIYNDGIQTVINMATIYGKQELALSTTVLMVTLLVIQFISIFGALLFSKLGAILSTKTALMLTLLLWSGVVIYAYFMTTATEYFILGVFVGLSMGGSQSLSRSLYGSMIPQNASAEFYGFYSVFDKFSSIMGPIVFALIKIITGEGRLAIISLIIFFIVGLALLAFVNVEKAREAKNSALFTDV